MEGGALRAPRDFQEKYKIRQADSGTYIQMKQENRRIKKGGGNPHPGKINIWEDREGNARPTPERLKRGKFELRDAEDAGARYAVDSEAHRIDQLEALGTIDRDQATAAAQFAELSSRNRLVSQGRSCLDFSPVGYDANIPDDPVSARDWRELYLAMGVAMHGECRRVCVEGHRLTSAKLLRSGLDICVKFFKT